MATLSDSGYPNLVNVTKRLKPDGSVETMLADTLSKELPILEDIPMVEGNLPTGHRITAVNALPSPTWRKFNQGIPSAKGDTLQYDETCGMLEALPKIDVALAELNGNSAAWRQSEDMLHLEGISQEVERSIFYESVTTSPEKIHGLTPRYKATTGYTSSGYVMVSGTPASSTACQSIWLISWDPNRVFGIYPKGSVAGLKHEDLGKRLVRDSNSLDYPAYVTHYKWNFGIAVKDYRYAVRLQWDPTDATQTDSAKLLYVSLENALGTLRKVLPSTRIYMSRTSRNKVAAQLGTNDTRFLEYNRDGGKLIESFLGIPIRITDTLVGETAVS
jgi:hypothetical protein